MLQHFSICPVFLWVLESTLIAPGVPGIEAAANLFIRFGHIFHINAHIAVDHFLAVRLVLANTERFAQALGDPSRSTLEACDLRARQLGHLREDLDPR